MQSYQYNLRQANTVLIRRFVAMDSYIESINSFVKELAFSMEVLENIPLENIYVVTTPKYCIYIYLPGSKRQLNHPHLPTVHIDIDQIINDQSKLIKRIRGLHGMGHRIYARQTVVARVDKKVTLDFLKEHHLNMAFPGKYRYGLFFEGELVSVAVFSGGRHMRDKGDNYRSFELIRFCHKGDFLVVGGLSKLIKAFVKDFNPQDIMTYADLDWTQESSLAAVGFQTSDKTEPQLFFVVDGIRKSSLADDTSTYYSIENRGSLKLKLVL